MAFLVIRHIDPEQAAFSFPYRSHEWSIEPDRDREGENERKLSFLSSSSSAISAPRYYHLYRHTHTFIRIYLLECIITALLYTYCTTTTLILLSQESGNKKDSRKYSTFFAPFPLKTTYSFSLSFFIEKDTEKVDRRGRGRLSDFFSSHSTRLEL